MEHKKMLDATLKIFKNLALTLMEMKFAPESLATAFANNVLPQPGGPYNNTPLAVVSPNAANLSGCLIG